MNTMHLEIVAPDGMVFSNNVKMVVLPGSEGEFGVLPGHASLVSLLKVGVIDIENVDGTHDIVAIDWGYAKVCESKVIVLVNGAEHVFGNSEGEIARSLERAKQIVSAMGDSNSMLAVAMSKMDNIARTK